MRRKRKIAAVLAISLLAVNTTCTWSDQDCATHSECESGYGTFLAAVTCDPYLEVYPVCGPHNGGYDGNWSNFTCPPHPAHSPDNSDYIGGDHYGNDIFGARGVPIVAGRSGTIVRAGYAGAGGNRVTIVDNCGWYTYYAHLDTITRWSGYVAAGTQIGTLGNTGAEWTAPHLHFSMYPDGCYDCGINPFPYLQAVDHTTGCTCGCVCTPGQTESSTCGACADPSLVCGTQSRSCGADCKWGPWSACAGPDPGGGNQDCDTGELGACAEGRMRCMAGCIGCARLHDPAAELCDGTDNDCNGEADEGGPEDMGDPPPPYAGQLLDFSYPRSLGQGEVAPAWVEFLNMGTETWREGDVWLGSLAAAGGEVSLFHVEDTWPSWDVASVLGGDVVSGETGLFELSIMAKASEGDEIIEGFALIDSDGQMMRCPGPGIEIEVRVTAGDADGGAQQDAGEEEEEPDDENTASAVGGGCGCTFIL
ncbi:MAG: M23 family metallopeptidase [Pseudomonadota bacterium]